LFRRRAVNDRLPVSKAGALALTLCVVVVVASCGGGGRLSPKALQEEAKQVQSLAAEGGVLAENAARGRATKTFVREQAGFLRGAAAASAQRLARAGNGGALTPLATRARDELGDLSRSGSDGALQKRVGVDLIRIAHHAARLTKS
jgi:hypothetical protein